MNESIPEEIVYTEGRLFNRPVKILNHPRFCNCIDCRTYYEESLALCAYAGCGYLPYVDCEKKYCYRHHRKQCGK